ncbi:MAG: hypothetical protein JWO05_2458 [Gemmatimonadetes bacterium]|nr:hypothetical protein [Gemmatimonadota bacterium]
MSILAAIAAPCALAAQDARGLGLPRPAMSAPIADVRYALRFRHDNATERRVHVTTTFRSAGAGDVILSLPAWTPGSYELVDFAKWVVGFSVTSEGKPLSWDKLDQDSWRIRVAAGRAVQVTYDVIADSLDVGLAWSRSDVLMVNGTAVFMYPEGRSLVYPSRVSVESEPEWHVVTGMTPAGARQYSAPSYHDLVDMPFLIGRYDLDSAQVEGRWFRYATYPEGSVSGAARAGMWKQLSAMVAPEARVFGGVPWATYTLMQISDSASQGGSGLEHQSSHVDIVNPAFLGDPVMHSLYAHEIFHAWNVKRLRPAEMWPYRYDRPQPTPWLWVSEGITDYYADLAEVRGGVVDASGFYALTAAKVEEVESAASVALEDASLSTWIHPADGTATLYYPKGSLAGLMLDIMIRDASDNAHSLDDVMRETYRATYAKGRGFTAADWWGTVQRMANGKSFADFDAKYVDGREAYPWDDVLPLGGMRLVREQVPWLGVTSVQDSLGVLVTAVDSGGAAYGAGIRPGDHLVSVGEIPVEDNQFGSRFRAKFSGVSEGAPLVIQVKRAGQLVTLAGRVKLAPAQPRIVADPNATPKAKRILEGIVKGP